MTRAAPLALSALLALAALGGCGSQGDAIPEIANSTVPTTDDDVEALPSDDLAAPEGAAVDSESGGDGSATTPDGNAT